MLRWDVPRLHRATGSPPSRVPAGESAPPKERTGRRSPPIRQKRKEPMAMNEDSVVSSLNELRRMANERSRREAEARARLEAERRAWEDRNRTNRHGETRSRPAEGRQDAKTHTMTYGFPEATIQVEGYGSVGGSQPNHQTIGQWQPAPAQTQTLAIAPSPQPMIETQTSRMSAAEWAAREEAPTA